MRRLGKGLYFSGSKGRSIIAMKLIVLAVGKIRSKPVSALASDYAGRLSHYNETRVIACRDERDMLARLKGGDFVVLLDAAGANRSSEELARLITDHRMRGTKRLVFMIGGPDGFGDELRGRADSTLSLSRMTFPHELAQAILLEQLYRACTIIKGEPYHK